MKSEKDRQEAVKAIRQMLSDSYTGEQPICHAEELNMLYSISEANVSTALTP